MRGHRSAVAAAFCTDDQVAFAGAAAAEFYFPLAYKEDFRRSRVPQPCAFVKEHAAGKKIAKIRLTPGWLGLFFFIPLMRGTPLIRRSFYVHLGLQIGLNFVPATILGKPWIEGRGDKIEFFCRL